MAGSSIKGRCAFALVVAGAALAAAAPPGKSADAARTIKADVAQMIAGLNAHDVMRTTAFDAPDIVSMEGGRPSSTGIEAERAGFRAGFAANPDWRVNLIDDTVDVAKAGDMAVYRGRYNEDSTRSGVPMTHRSSCSRGSSDGTTAPGPSHGKPSCRPGLLTTSEGGGGTRR